MSGLRIATFNVNGIRSRLPHLLQWLEREQPDIACLQELKAADEGFPRAQLEAAGYGARWQGQRSWNGVAILARGSRPIESLRGLPGDPEDGHSRYLEAVAHGVVVACLYLPNGNPQPGPKFDYKLRWFERLIAHARTLHDTGHPVVLAGDFNVVPTDELDIYNPRSWRRDALLQPASRAAWQRLLAQGWTDALRSLHPDEKIFTFWDYFREHWPRDAGLRIDHLLLSPALAPRLRAAGVDRWVRGLPGASDHAPTWIELDMENARARTGKASAAVRPPPAKRNAKAGQRAATVSTRKPASRQADPVSAEQPAKRATASPAAKPRAKSTAASTTRPAKAVTKSPRRSGKPATRPPKALAQPAAATARKPTGTRANQAVAPGRKTSVRKAASATDRPRRGAAAPGRPPRDKAAGSRPKRG